MKWNEIHEANFDNKRVEEWLSINVPSFNTSTLADRFSSTGKKGFEITDDGTVNTYNCDVYIQSPPESLTTIPVSFGRVDGTFNLCNQHKLRSMVGFPDECYTLLIKNNSFSEMTMTTKCDFFLARNNEFTSVAGIPNGCHAIDLSENYITSLIGVNDHLTYMQGSGCLDMSFEDIAAGGLGLLLVDGLKTLTSGNFNGKLNFAPAFDIIQKYLGRPDDIFECQAELIENGFEEFAQL